MIQLRTRYAYRRHIDKVVPAGKEDLIEVDSPLPNQEIESPLL